MPFRIPVFIITLLLFAAVSFAADSTAFQVRAVETEAPIIDGVLEPRWNAAQTITGFTQVEPVEGSIPSQRTYVYTLYTRHALYIAYDCRDSQPDSIAGRIQRRDNDSYSDAVFLELDTFHDRRTGYYFGVTAGGVQLDGTYLNESNRDATWDGVWESAVKRNDHGYVVEMKIPFQSFRHNGASAPWGFNVSRWIERSSEWDSWIPFARVRGSRVGEWGTLTGLEDIESSRHAELLPHVVGRWDSEDGGPWHSVNDWDNIGLDLKLVPASSWTLDLTFQPDFAQVDVDDEVINLSDYPVYLPEKRPFFLEGLSIFDSVPTTMLYTRKIADPDIGARVTGQWNGTRASVLAARNRSENDVSQAAAAGRVIRNIGRQSTIGFTVTSLTNLDTGGDNVVIDAQSGEDPPADTSFHANAFAVDTRLRWGEENSVSLYAAGLDRTDSPNQPVSAKAGLNLGKGHWRGSSWLDYKGQDFNINDLGFTGYSNVINSGFWVQRSSYPTDAWYNATWQNLNFWQETFPDGSHWEKGGNWNGSWRTANYNHFGGGIGLGDGYFRYTYDPDEDDNPEDFPYRHNFGRYRVDYYPWQSQWFWYSSDGRKPFSVEASIERGTLRDGKRWEAGSELHWKALASLDFDVEANWVQVWDVFDVYGGDLTDFRILRLRSRWSPGLDVSLRGTVQYVTDDVRVSNEDDSQSLLVNLLFSWYWAPGSWFYVVYDDSRGWPAELDDGSTVTHWNRGDRTIRMKWTWFVTVP